MQVRLVLSILIATGLLACASQQSSKPKTSSVPAGINYEKAMDAYINAANQYLKARDPDNALRHLRKAIDLNANDQRVQTGMAYAFELTQDFELAEQHHLRAIKMGGEGEMRARNNYATYLYKQGRYADAEEQLLVVVDDVLYPRRSAAFITLGLVNIQLGKKDEAIRTLSRAINMDRRNTIAALELADLLIEKREYRAAQVHYNTYRYLGRLSARGLLVGIKLAQALGNKDEMASNALALKNMFPQSREYATYLRLYRYDR